jgi:general secretion pathway protein D
VPSGSVIKILPDASARSIPGNDLPSSINSTSDEIVTQVIAVRNVSAAQLVPVLRPLVPQYGHLAAYPTSNMLIISDRAANVNRMMRIIQRIDQTGDEDIEVIRMEHASAAEVVRIVTTLSAGAQAEGGGGGPNVKLVADDRTNSVILSGERSQRLRLRTLIAHLDTPLEAGGDTQVRYLRYADAEKIATKMREQLQGIVAAAAPGAGGAGAAPPAATGQVDRSITIWAEPETNALVVTAPPKIMRSVMAIVDRLDIRRAQVLVEAILVEMSADKAMDLGINWAIADTSGDSNLPAGGFLSPVGGVGLGEILQALRSSGGDGNGGGTSIPNPTGLTIGVGDINDNGTSWAALVRALDGVGNTNIIATPSIVTLDNEEAEIKIAQEIPFLTGQYVTQGNTSGGIDNPFQTIQREEVGNILKITPQINEGNSVLLKISQEASNVAAQAQQVSSTDLITNKRTISTKVMVDDGGLIVLGGLISDQATDSRQQVPLLGSIPILGELFKTRGVKKTKTNLMVFIRPRILRDGTDAAIETNAKYNYIRDQQLQYNKGKVPLMPRERQPTLPPLETLVPPELLNPARTAAPPGTTPAERVEAGEGSGSVTTAPPTPPATTPPPPADSTTVPPATTPGTTPAPPPPEPESNTSTKEGTTP